MPERLAPEEEGHLHVRRDVNPSSRRRDVDGAPEGSQHVCLDELRTLRRVLGEGAQVPADAFAKRVMEERKQLIAQLAAIGPFRCGVLEVRHAILVSVLVDDALGMWEHRPVDEHAAHRRGGRDARHVEQLRALKDVTEHVLVQIPFVMTKEDATATGGLQARLVCVETNPSGLALVLIPLARRALHLTYGSHADLHTALSAPSLHEGRLGARLDAVRIVHMHRMDRITQPVRLA